MSVVMKSPVEALRAVDHPQIVDHPLVDDGLAVVHAQLGRDALRGFVGGHNCGHDAIGLGGCPRPLEQQGCGFGGVAFVLVLSPGNERAGCNMTLPTTVPSCRSTANQPNPGPLASLI